MELQENKRAEVCRFFALRESGNAIEFKIFNDYTMDCKAIGKKSIISINLQPNFIVEYVDDDDNVKTYVYDGEDKVVGFEINEYIKAYMDEIGIINTAPRISKENNIVRVVKARSFAKKTATISK
jgi:hypothetical protein